MFQITYKDAVSDKKKLEILMKDNRIYLSIVHYNKRISCPNTFHSNAANFVLECRAHNFENLKTKKDERLFRRAYCTLCQDVFDYLDNIQTKLNFAG